MKTTEQHPNGFKMTGVAILALLGVFLPLSYYIASPVSQHKYKVGDCFQEKSQEEWDLPTKSKIIKIGKYKYKYLTPEGFNLEKLISEVDPTTISVECGTSFL